MTDPYVIINKQSSNAYVALCSVMSRYAMLWKVQNLHSDCLLGYFGLSWYIETTLCVEQLLKDEIYLNTDALWPDVNKYTEATYPQVVKFTYAYGFSTASVYLS